MRNLIILTLFNHLLWNLWDGQGALPSNGLQIGWRRISFTRMRLNFAILQQKKSKTPQRGKVC